VRRCVQWVLGTVGGEGGLFSCSRHEPNVRTNGRPSARQVVRSDGRQLHIVTDKPNVRPNVMLNRDQGRSVMRASGRARVHAYRQARVTSHVHACVHEGRASGKKLKSLEQTAERSTPRRDFKSFRSHGRQRGMGILSTTSAHLTTFLVG